MIGMVRVGAAAVSADGLAVFAAKTYDFEAGKYDEQLYLIDIAAALACSESERHTHGHVTRLTGTKHKKNNTPQLSPDGAHVAFLSDRGGSMQVFVLPLRGPPGEAQQLTDLADDVGDLVWHASGAMLCSAGVYVDGEASEDPIQATAERDKAAKESKASALLFSSLPVRQWDRWLDAKMNHVFLLPVTREGSSYRLDGPPRDLLAGVPGECPVPPFGGAEDFGVSATRVAVSMRPPLAHDEAWSTNRHIYVRELAGTASGDLGTCLTEDNSGYDLCPEFSPDGRRLAWLSMATPQYEADASRIKVWDSSSGAVRTLAADWDYSPDGLLWSRDGTRLLFSANIRARSCLCAADAETGSITVLTEEGCSALCGETSSGTLVYTHTTLCCPAEIWVRYVDPQGDVVKAQLTFFNRDRLSELTLGLVRELSFAGAGAEQVQAWLVLPAGVGDLQELEPKSVPMAVVIHGGPQGAIMDSWHYRWHLQVYAARGFVTLAVNFHGSTGFGHAFCRSISGDWGGAPFEDILAGCRHVLAEHPCVDPERVCALGASYGGYMINYLNGNAPQGFFRCLVCHDGTFSIESSYYGTEELFFMEHEFGGVPWKAGADSSYRRFSPHLKVDQWKTPTLIIHGAKDYRLVETEGLAAFQALQRQGVPSELLLFPTENHWVLNPLNSLVWHDKVLGWLDRWTAK